MINKILIVGDLHLGLNLNYKNVSNIDLQFNYSKANIQFLIDNIGKLRPDTIIFLGDIFDKPKVEPKQLTIFKEFLSISKTLVKDIKFYLITGNHDFKSKDNNILQVFKENSVEIIDEITEIDDLLFIPYMEITRDIEQLENLDAKEKYIFSHLDVGYNLPYCIEPDLIFKSDYKYIFNGHIHKPYIKRQTKFINVGSVAPTDFSDTELHNIIYLNKEQNSLHYIPNYNIRFFDIQDIHHITDIYKEIEATNPKMAFIRYELSLEESITELIDHFKCIVAIQPYIKQVEKYPTINPIDNEENQQQDFKSIDELFNEYLLQKYNIDLQKLNTNLQEVYDNE